MRLLVLYLRSRRVPTALAAAVGGVAALWTLGQATDSQRAGALLGLLAVVAAIATAGPGLAGADIDLDRTAAIAWPPRRAAHVIAAGAVVIGLVAATGLAGAGQITRDAAGMSGLVALGAAALGAGRAWLPPLIWTLLAWTTRTMLWPAAGGATHQEVLTWMLQPARSTAALVTAVILGITGLGAYAILGPQR
jgi:hypothetical protein